LKGAKNPGVAVSLVDRRICSQTVEITPSLNVVDPHALATFEHHVERMVVVCSESVLLVDKVLSTLEALTLQLRHDVLSAWLINIYGQGTARQRLELSLMKGMGQFPALY